MADTIPARLFARAQATPLLPAYHVKRGDSWQSYSWRTYADEVKAAGKAMMALGLQPGGCVAILGFNRPEWVIFNLAAMSVGGAAAGVYTTSSAVETQYVVHHCEASLMLVENAAQFAKVASQRQHLPHLRHVVLMRNCEPIDDPLVMTWEQFCARGEAVADDDFEHRLQSLQDDQLATLIYTSGTTGPPKGVMLSHWNLSWTANALISVVGGDESERLLSYLPLSHIAEQTVSIHGAISRGGAVYFAESLEAVAQNLKEVQPTTFFGVPRIWEKMHAGVSEKLAALTGPKKHLVELARNTCTRVNQLRGRGEQPGRALSILYALMQRALIGKLKTALGFGQARILVSGAAPIARDVLEFFASLDLVVYEVYGQSEGTGPTTINSPGAVKLGSVGQPIPGCEVRTAEDGEILLRGPNVFLGYYKEEAATRAVLIDGWLHSGDLGQFDADGYLSITGRKKEILITAGGKNIAPRNIEEALKGNRLVAEAVLIGDRRKYLTALLVVEPEAAELFLAQSGDGDKTPHHQHPAIRAALQKTVDEINGNLAPVEQVKKFTVLPRALSVDQGELTPTLKLKRRIIAENFAAEIDGMYE